MSLTLALFQTVGPLELIIVLGIVLLIFGPKRLPSLGRQLGKGFTEFRDSIAGRSDDDDDEHDDDDTAADTRRPAAAALDRPEGETTTSSSDGVVSEKR